MRRLAGFWELILIEGLLVFTDEAPDGLAPSAAGAGDSLRSGFGIEVARG